MSNQLFVREVVRVPASRCRGPRFECGWNFSKTKSPLTVHLRIYDDMTLF